MSIVDGYDFGWIISSRYDVSFKSLSFKCRMGVGQNYIDKDPMLVTSAWRSERHVFRHSQSWSYRRNLYEVDVDMRKIISIDRNAK